MAVQSLGNKLRTMSVKGYTDRSEVKNEPNLPIYWDEDRQINFVNLSYIPKGDIISVVVTFFENAENAVIDGKFNIASNRIEFLPSDNISGNLAEVKYLI